MTTNGWQAFSNLWGSTFAWGVLHDAGADLRCTCYVAA
jgi:hypothetical protein